MQYQLLQMQILVLLLCGVVLVLSATPCNSTHHYALSSVCYMQCPWTAPTQYYSYDGNYTCQSTCPSSYFAFDGNYSCLQQCPEGTYYDYTNRKCVSICAANTYSYLNQSCLSQCPSGYWGSDQGWLCVATCPARTYYANTTIPLCVSSCPANYYGSPTDSTCYLGGQCPLTPVTYYSDDTTNLCVPLCPLNYYADNITARCLVYCSAGWFAQESTRTCVTTCQEGYFRSTVTRSCVRSCTIGYYADNATSNCVVLCSVGGFGDAASGKCLEECPSTLFGDPTVRLCVAVCSSGRYADNQTQQCVVATACYSNSIGDPTTHKCIYSNECPKSPYMFADLTNKVCTTRCNPTWGDPVTRTCVSSCPWNIGTYVSYMNSDTRQCVTTCPQYPITYADNFTKTCTSTCPQPPATPFPTYADPLSQTCLQQCPTGYVADNTSLSCVQKCSNIPNIQFFNPLTGSCVQQCPLGYFSDNVTGYCLPSCPSSPRTYSHASTRECLYVCPSDYYGDDSTGRCVSSCPPTALQYADPSTHLCVDQCPHSPNYYGQTALDGTRQCVSTCTLGYFADPLTRLCVTSCNMSDGYYGELVSPVRTCVLTCNSTAFKNNRTGLCVSLCENYPVKLYGDPTTTYCVKQCPVHLFANSDNNQCVMSANCPSGYYGDESTRKCVTLCPLDANTFGDSASRRCVQTCPNGTYADPNTRLCASTCSGWLYKDNSTNQCVKLCPSTPSLYVQSSTMECVPECANSYAYLPTRRCVAMCPSTPAYYADLETNTCLQSCRNGTFKFYNNTFRGCLRGCPDRVYSAAYRVPLYADNSTWSCVAVCPQASNLFAYTHPDFISQRRCVSTCPSINSTLQFSENVTQSCVERCPHETQLTYGDTFTLKCVLTCSRKQYRDNSTSRCVYHCSAGTFSDNSTWACVSQCPAGYFAEATNRTCVLECPSDSYADNDTRYCQALCNITEYLFSDNTTWACVDKCPAFPDFYSDNQTRMCTDSCSGGLFKDSATRSCMPALNCSNGTIGEPLSGRCVQVCPIAVPSFLDFAVNLCKTVCDSGFYADNSTMECVAQCPSEPDYYAFNHSIKGGLCIRFCPTAPTAFYRHNLTRECLPLCPGPDYFRDPLTMRCVTQCPPQYYTQDTDQQCVLNCSGWAQFGHLGTCLAICPLGLNADPTTFLCVQQCPFGWFAENGTCVTNCSDPLFADPFLKECVEMCTIDYYGYGPTRECRQDCQPLYKYLPNQSCIEECPASVNASLNLYKDNTTFSCLQQCLPGWYADNQTRSCNESCTPPFLADPSTTLCVEQCPEHPDFYGHEGICLFPCPSVTPAVYAENLTRTCMQICPNGSFADNYNLRCVAICTVLQWGVLGAAPECVLQCPDPLFGRNTTRQCVQYCPEGSFGDNDTRICMQRCPPGTFADRHLRLCVLVCNATIPEFADNSTQQCVVECPHIPSLYGDITDAVPECVFACQNASYYTLNTTRLCVDWCPEPYFGDPITGDCALHCPILHSLYADNVTRTCSPTCPNVTINGSSYFTYADDSTKNCVFTCPFNPSTYGDNSTSTCVKRCPDGSFGDNDTRLCLKTCFFGVLFNGIKKYTFADNQTNFCLAVCPAGSWADNLTFTCTENCTLGSYADNSTWKCVTMCPSNPISFALANNGTGICIQACPSGLFASEVGRMCLTTCPVTPYFYYRNVLTRQCVLKCVFPYFGEVSSQSCVSNCSYGYYQDLGNMKCAGCPSACLTCVNSQNCSTCQPGLYSHLGQCLTACPTFPVYYYKYDPSFTCLIGCPAPYFGFAGTARCELTCPGTYYKDDNTSSCLKCPTGCDSCLITACSTCITGYVHVAKYSTCSKMCSQVLPYYLQGSCSDSCPKGTFLLDDLVTCQKCSPVCSECSMKASNCTRCQGQFWYNYNCVGQCPNDYYVDSDNFCRQCSSNPAACTLPPLTYTVSTETVNYQMYIVVKFNRAVNLNNDQFAQIAKFQTKKGPLKSSQYKIVSSTGDTFRLKVLDATTLNELALTLSFTPGFIFDASGIGLSTITQETMVQTTTSISPALQASAEAVNSKVNVFSWLLIAVLAIMMFRCSYPLIVLLDLLQYLHLHLYVLVVPLPYLYMQALSALKNVNFLFLPVLSSNPTANPSAPYYNFQPDTSFLGNCQPLVFFAAIFGTAYLLIFFLSKRCNKIKCLRTRSKQIYKSRMRYSFIHEIFYYTVYYVFFIAVYQFTGNNADLPSSAGNLAAAVIVMIVYAAWLLWVVYLGSKFRKKIDAIPKKYQFLVYEESQFPMEIPLRALFKVVVGLVLISGEVSVQLILLMVFNLIYLIYTACYAPSKKMLTNALNIFLMAGLILIEIILFAYSTTAMSTDQQNIFSVILLSIMGTLVVTVLVWILYRFIVYIREDVMGIKPVEVEDKPKESQKHSSKQDYQKLKPVLKQSLYQSSSLVKLNPKQKELNISELDFKDEDERESDAPQITAEQAIQMFTYHHVPRKTEGLLKQERELMGVKEEKKEQKQIVIEIDQDQLIQSGVRIDSRMSGRGKDKKEKKRGHLKIQAEDSVQELEHIKLDKEKSESEESNYWNRRQREKAAKQREGLPQPEHKVVWAEEADQEQKSQE